MANFAVLTAAMNMNIKNFADGLRDAARMTSKFASDITGKLNNGLIEPAKKAKVEYKDVARIVQGILISKVFYSGLSAIRNATDVVWEFSKSLEYAEIAYTNLFGSAQLAEEFINVLEDFAAKTPFSFSDAEAASKRLLAYGVEYKNVMFMMQGIMAASAMQGNPEIIERVSRSMGQIYTKGRLMNEEMRQLAEAGIPAYQILREELGLTQEQLQNLGDEAIPASVAINALIEGMNKRFSGVVSASAMTMAGLISNIKDNALMMAQAITAPLYDAVKEGLGVIYEFMAEARIILDTKGLGGLFEFVVPESMQATMRAFIANLINLYNAVKPLVASMWELSKAVMYGLIQAFNILSPVIIPIIMVLSNLMYAIASNKYAMTALAGVLVACASAWFLFKVQAAGAMIITTVATAIRFCASAVWFLATALLAHPIFTILTAIAAALIFVAVSSTEAGNALQSLFSKLTAFAGVDPDKLLLPSQEDRAADINKFNEALNGTADSMSDLATETNKANKSLLSFDEVFKLNDVDETGGAGEIDTGIDIPEIPDMTVPDFTDYSTNFVDALANALKDAFNLKGFGELLAKLFWDPIKQAFGLVDAQGLADVITATFGGILTGLTKYMDDMFGKFQWGKFKIPWASMIDDEGKISLKVGFTSLKAAIKEALDQLKWPKFSIPWAEIIDDGAEVTPAFSGLKNIGAKTAEALKKAFSKESLKGFIDDTKAVWKLMMKEIAEDGIIGGLKNIGKSIDDVLKAAIFGLSKNSEGLKVGLKSFLKGFIVGAIADLTAGFFANLWVEKIKEIFNLKEEDLKNAGIGQTIGGILGGIIGSFFGPLGSIVGVAVGDLVGSILGVFWNRATSDVSAMWGKFMSWMGSQLNFNDGEGFFKNFLDFFIAGIGATFALIAAPFILAWEYVVGPILDAIGALFGVKVTAVLGDFFNGIGATLSSWAQAVGTAVSGVFNGIGGFVGSIGTAIGNFVAIIVQAKTSFVTFCNDVWGTFSNFIVNIANAISGGFNAAVGGIAGFFTTMFTTIGTTLTNIGTSVSTFVTTTWTSILTFITDVVTGVTGFITGLWTTVTTFFTDVVTGVTTFILTIWTSITTFFTTISTDMATFILGIWTSITTFILNVVTSIATFLLTVWTNITTFVLNVITSIATFLVGLWTSITTFLLNAVTGVATFLVTVWTSITDFLINATTGVANFLIGIWTTITNYLGQILGSIGGWINDTWNAFMGWFTSVTGGFDGWGAGIQNAVSGSLGAVIGVIGGWVGEAWGTFSGFWSGVVSGFESFGQGIYDAIAGWIGKALDVITNVVNAAKNAASSIGSFVTGGATASYSTSSMTGHAKGGVFNKEHVANFAEGNKAEAIIPLENNSAMQPFVDAVANGLLSVLGPLVANTGGGQSQNLQPLYVGTLIADDKGLKELNRKMQVIQLQEDSRRGE